MISKHSVPVLPEPTIERSRLLKLLQTALQHKLTLVIASPGYGKTTLVVQFAQGLDIPVIWQTLEEPDRDVPNLYAHTIATLAEIVPAIQTLSAQPHSTAGEMVSHITEFLRPHLSEDILYVLDDVHHLVGAPGGDEWLETLVATLPPCCHLVLIGRLLPHLPLTEMIERREVTAIGQTQLCFTADEIQQLVQEAGVDGAAVNAYLLAARLDGWPAGVIVALHPLPPEVADSLFAGQSGPEALFDRLAEDMLNAQPPLLQHFLLVSSTLSRMTPELCDHVLHLPDSAQYLAEGLQRPLFMQRISGGVSYHALFRDFLQRQLQIRHPEEFVALHRQAEEWFEAENRLDEALVHAVTAHLWGKAAAIAQQAAQAYFTQGKVETLLSWNVALREDPVDVPDLHHACAMIYIDRYQYDLAAVELAEAAKGFQALDDGAGLMKVELLVATLDNQRGHYSHALHRAEQLSRNPALPVNLQGLALVVCGVARLQLGDVQTALQNLETALPLIRAVGDVYSTSHALQYLELAYLRTGRFDEAGACLQEIVAIRRLHDSSFSLGLALNDLGYYYHQTAHYTRAFQTFQEGLSAVSRFPQHRAESYLRWSLGDLQRDRGAFDDADQHYQRAVELIGDREPALTCGLLNSLSVLRRWQGREDDAAQLAQEALHLAEHHHLSLEHIKAQVNLWVAHTRSEDLQVGQDALEHLASALRRQEAHIRLAQTWGLCAYMALRRADEEDAAQYLEWIAAAIPHSANLQLLMAEIYHTPLLKRFVEQQVPQQAALMDGLKQLEQAQIPLMAQERAPHHLPSIIYSLRVWTLGQERVERDGNLVASSSWRKMARGLFFYLLVNGATAREQIGLDFWPDSSSERVRHNVHTAIHRVRQALGHNAIVFQDDCYTVDPDLDVWCDAFELEALVQEARLLAPRTAHAERLWQRAVALYSGDWLPSIDGMWADRQREHFQTIYLEALTGLGNCMRARGGYAEAVTLYKRVIQVEPYQEAIHRLILMTYAEQGDRPHILKHYTELVALLAQELDAEPADETQALIKTLLA